MMKTEKQTRSDYVEISLILFGDKLDLEAITRLLKVNPSKSWRKGDIHTTFTGQKIVRSTGMWSYDKKFSECSFKQSLKQFFSLIRFDGRVKNKLESIEQVRLSGFIAISSDAHGAGGCEVFIGHDQMKFLFDIGAELLIDVYVD